MENNKEQEIALITLSATTLLCRSIGLQWRGCLSLCSEALIFEKLYHSLTGDLTRYNLQKKFSHLQPTAVLLSRSFITSSCVKC